MSGLWLWLLAATVRRACMQHMGAAAQCLIDHRIIQTDVRGKGATRTAGTAKRAVAVRPRRQSGAAVRRLEGRRRAHRPELGVNEGVRESAVLRRRERGCKLVVVEPPAARAVDDVVLRHEHRHRRLAGGAGPAGGAATAATAQPAGHVACEADRGREGAEEAAAEAGHARPAEAARLGRGLHVVAERSDGGREEGVHRGSDGCVAGVVVCGRDSRLDAGGPV